YRRRLPGPVFVNRFRRVPPAFRRRNAAAEGGRHAARMAEILRGRRHLALNHRPTEGKLWSWRRGLHHAERDGYCTAAVRLALLIGAPAALANPTRLSEGILCGKVPHLAFNHR